MTQLFAQIINDSTGQCNVGTGTNEEFYKQIGFELLDVAQSDVNGLWYIADKCPKKTELQKLQDAKTKKQNENQQALDIARNSHTFTVTLQNQECEFDTKDKTQSDLNSAAISASAGQPWLWTTNNRITLSLTPEDIQVVSIAYMQAVNADIAKWTAFEEQIERAETVEEVEKIVIDYNQSEDVEDE